MEKVDQAIGAVSSGRIRNLVISSGTTAQMISSVRRVLPEAVFFDLAALNATPLQLVQCLYQNISRMVVISGGSLLGSTHPLRHEFTAIIVAAMDGLVGYRSAVIDLKFLFYGSMIITTTRLTDMPGGILTRAMVVR